MGKSSNGSWDLMFGLNELVGKCRPQYFKCFNAERKTSIRLSMKLHNGMRIMEKLSRNV